MSKVSAATASRVARETDMAMDEARRRAAMLGHAITTHTPLDSVMSAEEGEAEDDFAIRSEGVARFLEAIFAEGPHPHHVMQRLFSLVRATRPELLANMPGRCIAAIFGQGRAAESARTKLLVATTFEAAGYRSAILPYMKSETASESYAAAQQGNTHRKGTGRAPVLRKASGLRK